MLQTARQLSEMAFGSIFVSALAVMESLWSHYTCTKLHRSGGASKPAYLHMHTLHAGIAPKVATLTADTTFSTRGRRVTDHTVACTSPLTHCPGYLQALEPSARPVQVFRAQLRCASCMLAQWQQHGAHLEPKLSLRLRCTSAWAVARATAQKCRCIVAVLAGTALAALAALPRRPRLALVVRSAFAACPCCPIQAACSTVAVYQPGSRVNLCVGRGACCFFCFVSFVFFARALDLSSQKCPPTRP